MSRQRLVGLLSAAGSLVLLALLFHPPTLPWARPMELTLDAPAFGELNQDASVEMAGVRVGGVEGLDLQAGRPLIRITVDAAHEALLHADASADIRAHGLLGPRYVELEPGSHGRMADGATIPISRVHVSTDVDQVLNALQPDVRASLQTVFVELGKASDNRGQDVNDTLRALGASSADLAQVTATLHARDQDLAQTVVASEQLDRDLQNAPIDAQIRDTDQVLTGLVKVDGEIGDGIDRTALLAQQLDVVMDGNSQNLAQALERAPATLARLRAVLVEATSIVNAINPAIPSLMTATVETESAFSASDANGHIVRIMSLAGSCTAGVNLGCAAPAAPAAAAPAAPASRLSDQDLGRLFLGQ